MPCDELLQPGSARNECRKGRSALQIHDLAIIVPQRLRWPAAACSKSKQGRRPQRPGNQSRFRAALDVFPFGNSLSRITAATGSAAIIRLSQELSRFAEPTLRQIVAPGKIKNLPPCEETVDDETSLWTTEEI